MATEDKKYLDLTGLQTLVTNIKTEDAKRVAKVQGTSAHTAEFAKVTTDSQGLVTGLTAVTKADITGLGIPGADTNQKIKSGSTTFGNDAVIDIVAGSNISVTPTTEGTGAPKITIAYTGAATDHNQTVKSGSVEFGADDVINIKADGTSGNPITITGNATNKEITIKHGTTTAADAAAVKVGKDTWGHVVIGGALTYTDIANTPTIGDATLTIQANGTSKGTFKANATTDATINITAADLGLSGAMHFKGVVEGSSLPATTNYEAGDVIILGGTGREYVLALNGASGAKKWNELGDESSFALKTTTITAGTGLTGGGSLAENRTISLDSKYNAAATPAAVKVGYDVYGRVELGAALTTASDGAHTHTVTGSVTIPTISPTSKHLTLDVTKTTSFLTGVSSTSSKLVTTTVTGVSGSTTASKATAGTAVTVAKRAASTTTVATRASSQTTVGNANVGSGIDCVTGFQNSGVAYQASYDSTNSALVLTALTPSTSNITPAVSSNTKIYGCGDNTSFYACEEGTQSITPYTFENVIVPKAASTATTVATGSVDNNASGAAIVTGFGTHPASTAVTAVGLLDTATSGGVTFVSAVSTGTTTASLADGAAASNGAHTHTIQ